MFGKSTFQEDLNELSTLLTNSPTKQTIMSFKDEVR